MLGGTVSISSDPGSRRQVASWAGPQGKAVEVVKANAKK